MGAHEDGINCKDTVKIIEPHATPWALCDGDDALPALRRPKNIQSIATMFCVDFVSSLVIAPAGYRMGAKHILGPSSLSLSWSSNCSTDVDCPGSSWILDLALVNAFQA